MQQGLVLLVRPERSDWLIFWLVLPLFLVGDIALVIFAAMILIGSTN